MGDAEHVADHAADTGVRAAERLDGRRVVVGLGLERDRRALGELDDAGVADEGRPHERRVDRVGACPELGEQRRDLLGPVGATGRVDDGAERLVGAVLAPRLREGLDLDVGDVAPETFELVTDDAQLLEVEVQGPFDVQGEEPVVVEAPDRDQFGVGVAGGVVEVRWLDEPVTPPFDDGVGDHATHHLVGEFGVDVGAELDASGGCCGGEFDAELAGGVHHGIGGGVGDPGQERDLDAVGGRSIPGDTLQQRVGHRRGESGALAVVERPGQVDHVGDLDRRRQVDAEVGGCRSDRGAAWVRIDGADGQSMPVGHCADPTDRAAGASCDCTKCSWPCPDPCGAQSCGLRASTSVWA